MELVPVPRSGRWWRVHPGAAGVIAALVVLTVAQGRPAAALAPVALVWNAPPGCPDARTVRDQVEHGLGGSAGELASVAAVAIVGQAGGRWQAELTLDTRGALAVRRFDAESCQALAEAAALIIALAAEGAEPASTTAPPRGLARAARDDAGPGGATSRSFWLQLGQSLDWGTMPGAPAPAIEAAAGESWRASRWRLRALVGASGFLPEDGPQVFGATGRYWALSLSGRACATAILAAFELGPCLGLEGVAMHGAHIAGLDTNSTQLWLSPLAGALATVTVTSRVALFARGDFIVPATRRTFWGQYYESSLAVEYTVPSFAIRGVVGVEVRFL